MTKSLQADEWFKGVDPIAGINLQETAIGVSHEIDPLFTSIKYVTSIKANMKSLKDAFSETTKLQYTNFMPEEWVPWEDEGYLISYRFLVEYRIFYDNTSVMMTVSK